MSWSWKVGRLAGIPIYIHWTFLILIAWVVFAHWSKTHDVAMTLEGVGFVLAIFGCVVLHELGHALAARRYGVPTADITLLPIGGVARLQRIPEHPTQELVVALAGPAVNVAIVILLLAIGVRARVDPSDNDFLVQARFLPKLLVVNQFLVFFNLLPAFPMDGGRVLRALLAMRLEYGRATRLAASVGQFMAIIFGFLGLMGNPMLLLIALFVWIGAEGEALQVQERLVLRGISVRDAMLTDFRTLSPTDSLGHAADLLLAGSQHDFPVMDDGHPRGVLTRDALLSALAQAGRDGRVGDAGLGELGSVEANAPLVPALARLRERGDACLQVVDRGAPVGLLTLENIGEFLMVRSALGATGQATA
jgi:Zn-dependent protease/CBS domain-containing protein